MAEVTERLKFFTTETLGPKMRKTQEGFLVCEDVPIARTGIQIYGPGETPIHPGPDGVVRINRTAEEVFSRDHIESYRGKPFVDGHPGFDVTPDNYRELTMGTILDPRRGTGEFADCLIADLVVYNADMIRTIESGEKREVSCGYEAEYVQTGDGEGEQRKIIGNHLALVDRARCGALCSISDSLQGATTMAKSLWDRIVCAAKGKDEAALAVLRKEAEDKLPAAGIRALVADEEGGMSGGGIHIHTMSTPPGASGDGRRWSDDALDKKFGEMETGMKDGFKKLGDSLEEFGKRLPKPADEAASAAEEERKKKEAEDNKEIEGALEEEAPAGTGDKARKATDSAYLADSYADTVSVAEIIAPGIQIPTFDAAEKPKKSYVGICQLRAKALTFGLNDPATNSMISAVAHREHTADSIKAMDCGRIRTLFFGVGEMKKASNGRSGTRGLDRTEPVVAGPSGAVKSLADLNKKNTDFYAAHK